jgi:hypothetical protein
MTRTLRLLLRAGILAGLVMISLNAFATQAAAGEVLDKETALQRLDAMNASLNALPRLGLHAQDVGRIFMIVQSVRQCQSAIMDVGVGHQRAVNAMQSLLSRFRYSSMFFTFITTRRNEATLRNLLENVRTLRQTSGVEENPFSVVIKAHLTSMGEALRQLKGQGGITESLRGQCTYLLAPLGHALAAVDPGDKPNAEALRLLSELRAKVTAIYPELSRATEIASAAPLALEIMGINEFLAEVTAVEAR